MTNAGWVAGVENPPHLAKQPGICEQSFLPCSQHDGGFSQSLPSMVIVGTALAGCTNWTGANIRPSAISAQSMRQTIAPGTRVFTPTG